MRSWGWGLCDGISALIRSGGLSLPLSPMRGHSKKAAVWKPGREFSPEPDRGGTVRGSTLTETHPPCPGTVVTICVSYSITGGPGKEHRTNKSSLTRRVQERSKETACVQPPPRILVAGIHLGWAICAPPGRTLSQNDWSKITQKLIPLP